MIITLDITKDEKKLLVKVLRQLINIKAIPKDTQAVIDHICNRYGFSEHTIRGRGRTKRIVEARHMTWYSLLQIGYTYTQISMEFNMDYHSIEYGCRTIQNRIDAGQLLVEL